MSENKLILQSGTTRSKIINLLLSQDLTALDISDRLGINESAIRSHLKNLENQELVNHYFKKVKKGRPKKYFSLTDSGEDLFPRETELLLTILIKHIQKKCGEKDLDDLMRIIASELDEYFPDIMNSDRLEEKVQKIVSGFDDLGFYCSYEKKDGEYFIEYKNCVFGRLPKKYAGYLCKAHRKIIENNLGEIEFQQEKSMLEGDNVCRQKIGEKYGSN